MTENMEKCPTPVVITVARHFLTYLLSGDDQSRVEWILSSAFTRSETYWSVS